MVELALKGGKKTKQKPFPAWPYYDEKEKAALQDVLESRIWWRTPGTRTLAFEKEFAKFHGAKHGLAVTNGTAALEVSMVGLGIKPGDEVIIPDFTFVATASAVLYAGALPVTVDVSPQTTVLIRNSPKQPSPPAPKRSLPCTWAVIPPILMLSVRLPNAKASR